ncbi:hypothetical protein [Brevundimonas sp.]|uniref:hypothetical protein n=1 Tax=Brevundimonas sp. TaxID=1871086 RepID=UPI001A315138|nr:hypothetical protein [Brevundimonas sp.]MBJ7484432.1 hypothetical protein [Brevundimonas sp.]
MAVWHVLGNELVSTAAFMGSAAEFDAVAAGGALTLPSGRALSKADLALGVTSGDDEPYGMLGDDATAQPRTDFVAIGLNRPLTIQIRHVYTGKYPRAGLLGFDKKKDLAVVSALKDYAVFAAASRAVNFLKSDVGQHANISGPTALEEGTSIVAYQPAVTSDSLTVTIEAAFDNFPKAFTDQIGGAFASAAGVPIFLPWAGYLMTASAVTKLAGGLADALFDGRPAFSFTETLAFNVPGSDIPKADFRILCSNTFDPQGLKFDPKRGLVDTETKAPYSGDEPYVVLSLDGAEREKLAAFAPTLASAAVLQRFFDMRDGAQASVGTVVEGLKLLSDSKYRADADALAIQIAKLPAGDPQHATLKARHVALVKNIASDTLKPAALT